MRLVILVCLASLAAGQDAPVDRSQGVLSEEYFPLKQGTKWVYTWIDSARKSQHTYEIGGTAKIGGAEYVVMKTGGKDHLAYRKSEEGILEGGIYLDTSSGWSRKRPEWLILKFGAKKGDRWTKSAHHGYEIEHAGEEEVTVPAGTFKAVKLVTTEKAKDGKSRITTEQTWYARGKGLVKWEMYVLDAMATYDLSSFTEGRLEASKAEPNKPAVNRPEITAALRELKDKDWTVRQKGIEKLVKLGARDTAREIAPLMRDADIFVRMSAVEALGHLDAKEFSNEIGELMKEEISKNELSTFVGKAAEALGVLGAKEYVKDIAKILKLHWGKGDAAVALARLGATEYIHEIASLLKDKDSWTRSGAAEALSRMGAREYSGEIAKLLKDSNEFVRGTAARELGMLAAKEFADQVAAVLKDPKPWVRGLAAWALGRMDAKEFSNQVAELVGDRADCSTYDATTRTYTPTTVSAVAESVLKSWSGK